MRYKNEKTQVNLHIITNFVNSLLFSILTKNNARKQKRQNKPS